MNPGATDSEKLPQGYEFVRFDPMLRLALPTDMAAVTREVLHERERAAEHSRREAVDRTRDTLVANAANERQDRVAKEQHARVEQKQRFERPVAEGFFRVLPNLGALLDERESAGAKLKSADDDINKRNQRLRSLLIERGPDRRLARPPQRREAMDELDATMPNFREPTRLLRNTLALADATGRPVRVAPMLLLGPPGVGKTFFSQRVAEMLGAPHSAIGFDQPSGGGSLRGGDAFWGNSSTGILFDLICMGEVANPVVLLDELDKSCIGGSDGLDPLAQLHGALEPQTSRRMLDVSVGIEFDASMTTYVATANSARGLGSPLLSRFEVFAIEPPSLDESFDIARTVVEQALRRLGLTGKLVFERRAVCLLANLSPRLMVRAVEQAVAAAVADGREDVIENHVWAEVCHADRGLRLH